MCLPECPIKFISTQSYYMYMYVQYVCPYMVCNTLCTVCTCMYSMCAHIWCVTHYVHVCTVCKHTTLVNKVLYMHIGIPEQTTVNNTLLLF